MVFDYYYENEGKNVSIAGESKGNSRICEENGTESSVKT